MQGYRSTGVGRLIHLMENGLHGETATTDLDISRGVHKASGYSFGFTIGFHWSGPKVGSGAC
jgi:hypothetical protein